MFAKIENNAVVEWAIPSLFALFPNTSFPSPLTNDALPEGYVAVNSFAPPEVQAHQKVVSSLPIQIEGRWVQGWDVVALSPAELAERDGIKAIAVRQERNALLSQSDWTQGKDIANSVSLEWVRYRQALRDLTNQAGFPLTLDWPVKP